MTTMTDTNRPWVVGIETEEGDRWEVGTEAIRPYGLRELLVSQQKIFDTGLPLQFVSTNATRNAEPIAATVTINTKVAFRELPSPYALVDGGWLPLPLAHPHHFLVDRNIVQRLSRIHSGGDGAADRQHRFWATMLDRAETLLNPLPYAWESNMRRKPSMDEFVAAYELGVRELTQALPGCRVWRCDSVQYKAAYEELENLNARNEREMKFLCDVCPRLSNRIGCGREQPILESVLTTADSHRLDRRSLAVIAAIACIYEHPQGEGLSVGRAVLKPSQHYDLGSAYNAISDLRHLELVIAIRSVATIEKHYLATGDRGLAALWCTLQPSNMRIEAGQVTWDFTPTPDLTPRLPPETVADFWRSCSRS